MAKLVCHLYPLPPGLPHHATFNIPHSHAGRTWGGENTKHRLMHLELGERGRFLIRFVQRQTHGTERAACTAVKPARKPGLGSGLRTAVLGPFLFQWSRLLTHGRFPAPLA